MLDKGSEALEANLPQGSISDGTIRHWVHSLSWAADRLPSTMRSLPVSKFKGKVSIDYSFCIRGKYFAMKLHVCILTSESSKRVVIILHYCAFNIIFLANSDFIFKI